MRDERAKAQAEVLDICRDYIDVSGDERFTRDEADDTLGKSWTNLIDVTVGGQTKVAELQAAIGNLRHKGYVATLESDSVVEIHVSTSHEVYERFREDS